MTFAFACGQAETALRMGTPDASGPPAMVADGGAGADAGAVTDADGGAGADAGADAGSGALAAEVRSDLVFRTVGGKSLAGDLYLPARSAPVAAVLVIHGGGFARGDKAGNAETSWSRHLKANGFAAFSVNYRVYSDFAAGEVPFRGAVDDLKCAVMWLRRNASTYRIDPAHIFALGGSAGGFMTNFLGTTGDEASFDPADCPGGAGESNRLQGVVTFYGPADWNALFTDPARAGTGNGEKRFLGLATACATPSDQAGICRTASATTYIDARDPPFFISHSDDDPVVPVGQSRLMKASLEDAGVSVQYREITGQAHGWHSKFGTPTIAALRDEIVLWLTALR